MISRINLWQENGTRRPGGDVRIHDAELPPGRLVLILCRVWHYLVVLLSRRFATGFVHCDLHGHDGVVDLGLEHLFSFLRFLEVAVAIWSVRSLHRPVHDLLRDELPARTLLWSLLLFTISPANGVWSDVLLGIFGTLFNPFLLVVRRQLALPDVVAEVEQNGDLPLHLLPLCVSRKLGCAFPGDLCACRLIGRGSRDFPPDLLRLCQLLQLLHFLLILGKHHTEFVSSNYKRLLT